MKKNIAVYAGTFDPVTNGHLDIIERASRMFDTLYVTICINPNKQGLFSIDERKELLKAACQQFDNVIIVLLINYQLNMLKMLVLELLFEELEQLWILNTNYNLLFLINI